MSLRKMRYQDYLQTRHWRGLRQQIIERDGFACRACGDRNLDGLHVHHKTYQRRGAENPSDLLTLCRACHKALHREHVPPWQWSGAEFERRPKNPVARRVANLIRRGTEKLATRITTYVDADEPDLPRCDTCNQSLRRATWDFGAHLARGYQRKRIGSLWVCFTCADGFSRAAAHRQQGAVGVAQ